jgi:hypothetical protein
LIPSIGMATQARLLVKRTPWLYRPAKRLTGRGARDHLCTSDTELCIEGYPSSGNSFSFALLRLANGRVRIAHHCHSVANLRIAIGYGVPAICLIRDPGDAIASRLARFDGRLREAVIEYIDFYRFAAARRDRLTIVTFDELVGDAGRFLARVRRASGLPFAVDDIDALERAARQYMTRWSARQGEPGRISLPRAGRDAAKLKLRDAILAAPGFADARALWRELAPPGGAPVTPPPT